MRIIFLLSVVFGMTCLISCSSPQSDGEKAAKAYIECMEFYNNDLESRLHDFIENFEDYNFQSRIEARNKVDEIIREADLEYEKNVKKADQQYLEAKKKYIKNQKDYETLEFAYNTYIDIYDATRNGIPFSQDIELKIQTIIPPKPSIERMKQDLVGRYCQDKEDGYFGTYRHLIKEGTVKDIEILSDSSGRNEYLLKAIISLQDRPGSATYKVNSEIKYILGDGDDWTIDYLGSNSVEIVKTGQFNKFITSSIANGWEKELRIKNHSDATLIVGGIILRDRGGKSSWQKFSATVEPNSTETIGGLFFGNVTDYEIHFVERK